MNIAAPESVGLSSQRLERIRPALQAFIDAGQAPGFQVAIMRKGKLAYLDSFGWQDIEERNPLQSDAIFRIYSMTKPVTMTALMMLYEEGRVVLQEPVARYLPKFKNLKVYTPDLAGRVVKLEPIQRDITILDLALHTAGLGYGLFQDSPVEDLFRAAGFIHYDKLTGTVPLSELIDRVLDLPLANQPGQRWRYSIAIDVIGRLVELISGQPFDVFLKERIFDPLGMVDTGFFAPPEKLGRLATLYAANPDGPIQSLDRPVDSPFTRPDATASGGSGLLSTTSDYLRFQQMLLNGGELDGTRLLGRTTVARMASNHLPANLLPMNAGGLFDFWGMGFGLGFGMVMDAALEGSGRSPGAFFWSGAAATDMFIDPREKLTGLLMTQVLNNMTPIHQVFYQVVYQAIVD